MNIFIYILIKKVKIEPSTIARGAIKLIYKIIHLTNINIRCLYDNIVLKWKIIDNTEHLMIYCDKNCDKNVAHN